MVGPQFILEAAPPTSIDFQTWSIIGTNNCWQYKPNAIGNGLVSNTVKKSLTNIPRQSVGTRNLLDER